MRYATQLLVAVVLSSCASTTVDTSTDDLLSQRTTVFPSFTIFPVEEKVSRSIVDRLPSRITQLPQGSTMTMLQVIDALGLTAHRNNVSGNLRWNTFFFYLDSDNILYFEVDVSSNHPGLRPFVPHWDVPVIACQLHRNPNLLITERRLLTYDELIELQDKASSRRQP